METILKTVDLVKYYGDGESQVRAIDHTSIEVENGEFVAIVGRSGSGKSTLLHMLGGLDRPDSGEVMIGGKNIFSLKDEQLAVFRRRKIGFIFQDFNLIPALNVWENIILPLGLDGKKVNRDFVMDIVKSIGLSKKLKSLPSQLSGGQKQRVGIARAMAASPDILLMDEPFGAVDEITRGQLQDELLCLHQASGITVLFVTHDIGEALKLGTRTLVLEAGEVQQYAPPSEILNGPATPFVEELVCRSRQFQARA